VSSDNIFRIRNNRVLVRTEPGYSDVQGRIVLEKSEENSLHHFFLPPFEILGQQADQLTRNQFPCSVNIILDISPQVAFAVRRPRKFPRLPW
jgi:hypothetical protein